MLQGETLAPRISGTPDSDSEDLTLKLQCQHLDLVAARRDLDLLLKDVLEDLKDCLQHLPVTKDDLFGERCREAKELLMARTKEDSTLKILKALKRECPGRTPKWDHSVNPTSKRAQPSATSTSKQSSKSQ